MILTFLYCSCCVLRYSGICYRVLWTATCTIERSSIVVQYKYSTTCMLVQYVPVLVPYCNTVVAVLLERYVPVRTTTRYQTRLRTVQKEYVLLQYKYYLNVTACRYKQEVKTERSSMLPLDLDSTTSSTGTVL